MARSRRVLPIGGVLGTIRQVLGSGGVKRVVTGRRAPREWGPVGIYESSWDPPNPSLMRHVARSRRILPMLSGSILR